jgi:hypothetical protein
MNTSRHPLLFQLNTRVMLRDLAKTLGRPTVLDDIPDHTLDTLAQHGFEWIYLLGAWQTGSAALQVSLTQPGLRTEYQHTLADFTDEDVCGSCFAITGYTAHPGLGGNAALQRLRQRMAQRGLRLMLDFVPNHTAPDHPWVEAHPEYFIQGSEEDLVREPHNFTRIHTHGQSRVFAFGRDPYFPGWADTLQLDYSQPQTILAMQEELVRTAELCDGLRCDMAMLLLPEIFQRTWGRTAGTFWPESIRRVKSTNPDFVFMAEVYWDLEAVLLELGFDYTYDKRLYDRLRDGQAAAVRDHLRADPAYLGHMVHFIENHDEQRAAAVFSPEKHRAAATACFFTPGVRFFHQGQLEGRKVKVSIHLQRAPHEPPDPSLAPFYQDLIKTLAQPLFAEGQWQLLEAAATTEDGQPLDSILAYRWELGNEEQAVVVINYADQPVQGRLQFHSNENFVSLHLPAWGTQILK